MLLVFKLENFFNSLVNNKQVKKIQDNCFTVKCKSIQYTVYDNGVSYNGEKIGH